jgi:hypothetical protein
VPQSCSPTADRAITVDNETYIPLQLEDHAPAVARAPIDVVVHIVSDS